MRLRIGDPLHFIMNQGSTVRYREMLPKYIYEALPALYFMLGILCVITIESSIALIPSAMLITAALLIYLMRRLYRSQGVEHKRE